MLFVFGTEGTEIGQKGLELGVSTAAAVAHGAFPKAETKIQDHSTWAKVGLIMLRAIPGT